MASQSLPHLSLASNKASLVSGVIYVLPVWKMYIVEKGIVMDYFAKPGTALALWRGLNIATSGACDLTHPVL